MFTLARAAAWVGCLLLCGALGACASTKPHGAPESKAPKLSPESVPIFRGGSGERVTLADLISAAAAADVVLIGENHGHPTGLATAAAVWQGTLDRSPKAALSMEFFERDEQKAVDDYLTGLTTEAQFTKVLGRTSSNYPPGHRTMVEAAKAKNRPVIAANSPRLYVRTARTDGYDRLRQLFEEQRRLFRIPESLPTGRYRTDFDKVMNSMTEPPPEMTPEHIAELDAKFRSQSLWDWTMADSIAKALDAGNTPVLHVVGRFHTDFAGGTVQALQHIRPPTRIVTISFVEVDSSSLRDEDKGRADFVLYPGVQ